MTKKTKTQDLQITFIHQFKRATRTIPKKNNEKVFHKLSEALIYLKKVLNSGDALMIKGSNATGLNKFSKNIKKGQISAI